MKVGQQQLEYRFRHKDGTYHWLHDEFNLVRDKQDAPLEYIGSLIDITAAKEAQEKLALSEQRYRAIVECQTDLINRFKPDTTLLYVNEAICRFVRPKSGRAARPIFSPVFNVRRPATGYFTHPLSDPGTPRG